MILNQQSAGSQPLRILHVANMNSDSGVACFIMNYYRHMDKKRIQFDFVVDKIIKNNFIDEIKSLGGNVFIVPEHRNNLYNYYHALNKILTCHKYRVIHAHESILSLVALYIAKKNGVEIRIAHSHNALMGSLLKNIIVYICRPFFRIYCTHFFACSAKAAQFLFGKKMYKKSTVKIIFNAIDVKAWKYTPLKRPQIRKLLDLPDEKFIIGHVGRMDYQKNHTFLLKIFSHIIKKDKNCKLILIGDGALHDDIVNEIEQLDLTSYVLCLGVRNDVPELMQAMDVFVLPSHHEGLPVVGIEAQTSGLPCVFSSTITKEVNITKNVEFIDLEADKEYWANRILLRKGYTRVATDAQVKEAGYDIVDQAQNLEKFYLKSL